MKKSANFFTVILACFFLQNSYGQDSLKASYGKCLTELNVNLFQGELSLNNMLNQVKFRYMASDAIALRVGVTVDSKKINDVDENVYGTSPYKKDDTKKSTMIGVNFGFEKHFAGTKRLSPYIGAELSIGYKWSENVIETSTNTTNTTNTSTTTTIDGSWSQSQYVQYSNGSYYTFTSYNNERGFVSYGLNIVTGFDFYIAKHLFIGYELELGFTQKDYTKVDITIKNNSGSTPPNNTYPSVPDVKEFSFGPRIINGIRIGYVF